jgi:hypothetical protein
MNEMNEAPLPRLNDDPEPGELDDYATSPQEPDAKILAQAKGEAEIPTAPPPRDVGDSEPRAEPRKPHDEVRARRRADD